MTQFFYHRDFDLDMLEEIPLSLLEDNPFNTRSEYHGQDVAILADSVSENGLLSPIKVRKILGRYQIVYGHRRVRAAKLLGRSTISAEVVSVSDREMLKLSLVENMMRRNLSDYEVAISFLRMSKEFGMSHEEIGKLVGFSRSHISNYLRMLELFEGDDIEADQLTKEARHRISEHHARVLLQIEDRKTRLNALKLAVSENLSVRELSNIVHRFRSWFESDRISKESTANSIFAERTNDKRMKDKTEIEQCLVAEFELPRKGDFESFSNKHDFHGQFSIYSNFPPFERLEKTKALDKERHWFYSVAPTLSAKVQDIHVHFISEDVALATLYVFYKGKAKAIQESMKVRGSVLFHKKDKSWRIIHEHWSRLDQHHRIPA